MIFATKIEFLKSMLGLEIEFLKSMLGLEIVVALTPHDIIEINYCYNRRCAFIKIVIFPRSSRPAPDTRMRTYGTSHVATDLSTDLSRSCQLSRVEFSVLPAK